SENRHAPLEFTQFPPGALRDTCGPRLLKPTLVPTLRSPATPATPLQLAGEPTGPPSLPAEATISPPLATSSVTTCCCAAVHDPVPPRLKLMICAGYGLSGTPVTCRPAAQRIPSRMSESRPPHLPSARTGRIFPCQVIPATPVALLAMAPRMPTTRVPCHELLPTVQLAKVGFCRSLEATQSPGSEASGSRPSPSLATAGSE